MAEMMRLLGSTRSPFTRKVRVAIELLGVSDRVEWVETMASQYRVAFDPALAAANPLLQIPVLIPENGAPIADSSVICAWLDHRFGPGRLIPADPEARIGCLSREAFADNLTAKLLRRAEELRRPEAARSQPWLEANLATIHRALDVLAVGITASPLDIGAISTITALDYVDFRFAELEWRNLRGALAAWHAHLAAETAFLKTPFLD